MSKQNIPARVLKIIVAERARQQAERQEAERQDEIQRLQWLNAGRDIVDEYIQQELQRHPEWLRKYVDSEVCEESLIRIGRGWDKCIFHLLFKIPGCLPIQARGDGEYRAAETDWDGYREVDVPKWRFRGDWWYPIEATLVKAEAEYRRLDDLQSQYKQRQSERTAWRQKEEGRQAERDAQNAKAEQKKQDEDLQLFSLWKDDPVLVQFVKMMLAIVQERRTMVEQIETADDALYSAEERWSRKAADLRRQAEQAERNAEEERIRASQMADDLASVEKKLKKAERGW